jgi:hypothetical protein
MPAKNDGKTIHRITLRDVPSWVLVDQRLQLRGYFEAQLGLLDRQHHAERCADGAVTVRIGSCDAGTLTAPIMPGWNHTLRLYRPRRDPVREWKVPEAQAIAPTVSRRPSSSCEHADRPSPRCARRTRDAGATYNDVVYWSKPADSRLQSRRRMARRATSGSTSTPATAPS